MLGEEREGREGREAPQPGICTSRARLCFDMITNINCLKKHQMGGAAGNVWLWVVVVRLRVRERETASFYCYTAHTYKYIYIYTVNIYTYTYINTYIGLYLKYFNRIKNSEIYVNQQILLFVLVKNTIQIIHFHPMRLKQNVKLIGIR